jgi:hypothetical protein
MPFLHQPDGGDGKVVEHAITRARVRQRMVTAAGAVGGKASLDRNQRRLKGAARNAHGTAGNLLVDREADPPFLVARHPGLDHLSDIDRVVHRLQPVARHRLRLDPVDLPAAAHQQFADEPVLVPLKSAAWPSGRDIVAMMDDRDHGA